MKNFFGIILLIIAVLILPMNLFSWQSHEYKFSFDTPDDSWKDLGDARPGVFKDSLVEFSSSNGYFFSVTAYPYRVDEVLPFESARKTAETCVSMIKASALQIWLISQTRDCFVNGVPGYKIELCYAYAGRLYAGTVIVLVKNNMHYRLMYVALDETYDASYADMKRILKTFKISD
jgi:hypothetical protein